MSCKYYSFKSSLFGGDYWCDKKNCEINTDHYQRYCRSYNYDECPIYKYNESSSTCFITTIVCEILGKEDNHEVLENLRAFRNNVLQKDETYAEILKEYDTIGTMIADCIRQDNNKKELSEILYKHHLVPISKLVKKEQNDWAISCYQRMTIWLITYYNLNEEYKKLKENNYYYEDFQQSQAGHGYRRVKQKPKTSKI